jgi:hypothetical protein
MGSVDPAYLAGLLWNMHNTRNQAEAFYPEDVFSHREILPEF